MLAAATRAARSVRGGAGPSEAAQVRRRRRGPSVATWSVSGGAVRQWRRGPLEAARPIRGGGAVEAAGPYIAGLTEAAQAVEAARAVEAPKRLEAGAEGLDGFGYVAGLAEGFNYGSAVSAVADFQGQLQVDHVY
jgi:hypothetical protein